MNRVDVMTWVGVLLTPVVTIAVCFALDGCGGQKWTAADTESAHAEMNLAVYLLRDCQTDAGECTAAQVRAVGAPLCANPAGQLMAHGLGDGGGCP